MVYVNAYAHLIAARSDELLASAATKPPGRDCAPTRLPAAAAAAGPDGAATANAEVDRCRALRRVLPQR